MSNFSVAKNKHFNNIKIVFSCFYELSINFLNHSKVSNKIQFCLGSFSTSESKKKPWLFQELKTENWILEMACPFSNVTLALNKDLINPLWIVDSLIKWHLHSGTTKNTLLEINTFQDKKDNIFFFFSHG